MTRTQRLRRARLMVVWRMANPAARHLAGIARWWVVLETTGRRSGKPRQTPLARGPVHGDALWLIAVHGRHSGWVRNVEAAPSVRVKLAGRWLAGSASVLPFDPERVRGFSRYSRLGPTTVGIDPLLVRVDLSAPLTPP